MSFASFVGHRVRSVTSCAEVTYRGLRECLHVALFLFRVLSDGDHILRDFSTIRVEFTTLRHQKSSFPPFVSPSVSTARHFSTRDTRDTGGMHPAKRARSRAHTVNDFVARSLRFQRCVNGQRRTSREIVRARRNEPPQLCLRSNQQDG